MLKLCFTSSDFYLGNRAIEIGHSVWIRLLSSVKIEGFLGFFKLYSLYHPILFIIYPFFIVPNWMQKYFLCTCSIYFLDITYVETVVNIWLIALDLEFRSCQDYPRWSRKDRGRGRRFLAPPSFSRRSSTQLEVISSWWNNTHGTKIGIEWHFDPKGRPSGHFFRLGFQLLAELCLPPFPVRIFLFPFVKPPNKWAVSRQIERMHVSRKQPWKQTKMSHQIPRWLRRSLGQRNGSQVTFPLTIKFSATEAVLRPQIIELQTKEWSITKTQFDSKTKTKKRGINQSPRGVGAVDSTPLNFPVDTNRVNGSPTMNYGSKRCRGVWILMSLSGDH